MLLPAQHSLPRRELSRVVNKCWAVTQSQNLAGGDRPKPVQAALTAAVLITHSLCAATERPGRFSCIFKNEICKLRSIISGLILTKHLCGKWITIYFSPICIHRNTSLAHALALHKYKMWRTKKQKWRTERLSASTARFICRCFSDWKVAEMSVSLCKRVMSLSTHEQHSQWTHSGGRVLRLTPPASGPVSEQD